MPDCEQQRTWLIDAAERVLELLSLGPLDYAARYGPDADQETDIGEAVRSLRTAVYEAKK